jgi:hypothetical protein
MTETMYVGGWRVAVTPSDPTATGGICGSGVGFELEPVGPVERLALASRVWLGWLEARGGDPHETSRTHAASQTVARRLLRSLTHGETEPGPFSYNRLRARAVVREDSLEPGIELRGGVCNIRDELDRFLRLGMLVEVPPTPADRRRYYREPTASCGLQSKAL